MSKRYEKDVSKPAGRLEFGADVLVPFAVSVVTGTLSGALLAVVSIAKGGGGGHAFAVGAVAVALLTWLWLLLADDRRVVWQTERVLQVDLDADGVVGAPAPAPAPVVRVEVEAGQTLQFVDFHGLTDIVQLRTFARLALEGELSERQVAGALGLARSDWLALRDELMSRELLTWNNREHRRQGVSVTRRGADVLEGVLKTERLLTG